MRWELLAMLFGMICCIWLAQCNPPADKAPLVTEPILSKLETGNYKFEYGDVLLEVMPALGGRISRLAYANEDILTSRDLGDLAFGSTLWPSPQSRWGWPPPAQLDKGNYISRVNGDTLFMKSEIDSTLQLSFEKMIYFSPSDTTIHLRYSIEHHVDTIQWVAPWENTRVPKGGLAFFPQGESPPKGKGLGYPIPGFEKGGIYWYHNKVDTNKTHLLSIADCGQSGWLAFARKGLMLVKVFNDMRPSLQAPGEGEIALYVSPEQPFMEIEVEGPFTGLLGGNALSWHMQWVVRPLPEGETIEAGNQILVEMASKLAKQRKY
ncbi:MAG: hypothetical protein AAF502_07745 [Bacteroidota bacterium]